MGVKLEGVEIGLKSNFHASARRRLFLYGILEVIQEILFVGFTKDWTVFNNALAFENHFEAEGYVKRDWKLKNHRGPEMFGWVARADDYRCQGPIGAFLRENGDLKTVGDLESEEAHKTDQLVATLASDIEVKNSHVEKLKSKCNETTASLDMMMEQREQILQKYNEGFCSSFIFYVFC